MDSVVTVSYMKLLKDIKPTWPQENIAMYLSFDTKHV